MNKLNNFLENIKQNNFQQVCNLPDKIKSLNFVSNDSFTYNYFFNEDTVSNRNYPFIDNNISIEKEEPYIVSENNDLQLYGIETFDKENEITQNGITLNEDFFTLKKNRNNFNFFLEDKNNYLKNDLGNLRSINLNTSINLSELKTVKNNNYSNMRCDTLLIKFKSVLGKWFIQYINNKLKSILKRRVKFFSFNYKKFTIIVSYLKNKKWLDTKIKDLLILGDEPNQTKNQKALNSIYKKNYEQLNVVKNILEQSYRNIIELFYLSEEFIKFKNDKKVIEMNENFIKIMDISILEHNGFIKFLEYRKGNTRKK